MPRAAELYREQIDLGLGGDPGGPSMECSQQPQAHAITLWTEQFDPKSPPLRAGPLTMLGGSLWGASQSRQGGKF
jgi:hypothetical protein